MISLGIDIGTSKIAFVLCDPAGATLYHQNFAHSAENTNQPQGFAEQDTLTIRDKIVSALEEIPSNLKSQIQVLGITGQMHGILLWNSNNFSEVTNLVTWQDSRADSSYLNEVSELTNENNLSSGFGLITLAWWQKNSASLISKYNSAGTIMDYLASYLTNNQKVLIDASNAASWGFYDLEGANWKFDKLELLNINSESLPTVAESYSIVGTNIHQTLPIGAKVILPIGDNQASLYSTLQTPENNLGITIGTGAQISVLLDPQQAKNLLLKSGTEIRPFFNSKVALVGAILNGGQSFAWMPAWIEQWCKQLELTNFNRERIYSALDDLALNSDSTLDVNSTFQGERYNPSLKGSICNINYDNFLPGSLFSSLVESTLENLKGLIPTEFLSNCNKIVGSGNGIRRLKVVQSKLQEVFNLPLILSDSQEEAAHGAAIFARDALRKG